MASKTRLDQEVTARGLFESREKAQRAIMAGEVWVNGHRWDKPSAPCPPDALIEHRGRDKYVSRGGLKMEGALHAFGLAPSGWRCLDVGASTGGFTDCLLQHGAAHVTALDVGHGQLHWKLREDPRVRAIERVNARELASADLGEPFRLIVTDVSFISLRLVLPPAVQRLGRPGDVVALIKPQFEAGPEQVGKGGIVRDEGVRRMVVEELRHWAETHLPGLRTSSVVPSPIEGRDGNVEYLWHLVGRVERLGFPARGRHFSHGAHGVH